MASKRPRDGSPSSAQKRSRGFGTSSSNVKLGTELPVEDHDDGSFVPVWKQTVTDEQGRRRLHGAFTGGFSAGYFNTVGSKEGWTPKSFVSSRSNRKKDQPNASTQRPEDFMDNEDLAEAAESRQLESANSFAAIGETYGAAARDDFFGLFVTGEDTMGVSILQKMGWKKGQGIGRKIRRSAQVADDDNEENDTTSQHMFAPKDSRAMLITGHDPRKGLGFQTDGRISKDEPEDEDDESRFSLSFSRKLNRPIPQTKSRMKSSSFGVGVLNDTGSDDDDPYELGPKISFNRTLGKDKKAKKPSKFARANGGDKHVFMSKKGASAKATSLSMTSRDGRAVLKGFTLANNDTYQPKKTKYPPPTIPPGWVSAKSISQAVETPTFQSVADAARSSTLDSKARASLLGEKPLPGKSIFDYISKEDRDRIAVLTGRTDLPQGLGQSLPGGQKPENQKSLWTWVPILDKSVAAAALAKGATGWMPYAEDLKKRARYVSFLELKAGINEKIPERAPGFSIPDWTNEMREFAQAADVFKPTSGIMASRFTSSGSSGPQSNGTTTDNRPLHASSSNVEDPAEQAAKLGMYGPMTRSTFSFHPTRLLCKRFNVLPPANAASNAEATGDAFQSKTQEAVSKNDLNKMMQELLTNGPAIQRPAWMNQPKETVKDAGAPANPLEHAPVDVENNEALSKERAPEDVFKAIFGDDNSDEDDD